MEACFLRFDSPNKELAYLAGVMFGGLAGGPANPLSRA